MKNRTRKHLGVYNSYNLFECKIIFWNKVSLALYVIFVGVWLIVVTIIYVINLMRNRFISEF